MDDQIGAYLTVTADLALEQAAAADKRLAASDNGPLLGLPIALKDVLTTAGVETTCASRILQGFTPPYDATAVTRLKAAGAVTLGKTNMDEFAMGSSNEHSAYKPVRNPWDLDKVPGGSSGGSAAAVAADECLAALGIRHRRVGSSAGGALCGCVGLKPTYGRISRFGLIAFASSLDQIGVLTKDVTDAALLLGALAGHDPRDSTSAEETVPELRSRVGRRHRRAAHRRGARVLRRGAGSAGRRFRPRRHRLPALALEPPSARFRCPTPNTPCRPTTSSPRPRPAPTWPATTASSTASPTRRPPTWTR